MQIRAYNFLLLISCSCFSGAMLRADETTETIRNAWQNRAERFRSARIHWDVSTTYPAGGLNLEATIFGNRATQLAIENGTLIPDKDTTIEASHKMLLIGTDMRFDFESVKWSFDDLSVYKRPCQTLSANNKTIAYQPNGLGESESRTSLHSKDGYSIFALQIYSLPVTLHCLPLQPHYDQYAPANLGSITSRKRDDGLIELVCQLDAGQRSRVVVDPNRDHVVVRIEDLNQTGIVLREFDISYAPNAKLGYFPSGWKAVSRNIRGQVVSHVSATVKSAEINAKIDPRELELNLGHATIVVGDGPTPYILGSDGEKRVLSDKEMQMPYSEVVKLLDSPTSLWKRWTTYIVIALLLVAAFFSIRLAFRVYRK